MIAVTSCRPMGDDPQYDRNQLAAWESWHKVFDAIIYLNDPQPQLRSPITRFYPWEPYPRIRDMIDICADQEDWSCLINADIVVGPHFKKLEQKLKTKKAVAASSWRWTFNPDVGLNPCEHKDYGCDFFAAQPGAWEMVYRAMCAPSPRGDEDSPTHLRFGAPSWDQWQLGAFFKLFSTMGFYNLTDARVIFHPEHLGRKHGGGVPPVHFLGWPVMGSSIL